MPTVIESADGNQIEIYRKQPMAVIGKAKEEVKNSRLQNNPYSRSLELAGKLGLDRQVKQLQQATYATTRSAIDPALFYREVSDKERQIWRAFLPTRYQKRDTEALVMVDSFDPWHWDRYDFDIIPEEALEEISFAWSTGFFQYIEIRTPEKADINDPAVFALSWDDRWFMIARWAESLAPFEDIKRHVLGSPWTRTWRRWMSFGLWLTLTVGMITLAELVAGGGSLANGFWILPALGFSAMIGHLLRCAYLARQDLP